MQDKFRLDLTDEQAVQYMQSLIDVSVTATFAALVEQMHKFAQVRRVYNSFTAVCVFEDLTEGKLRSFLGHHFLGMELKHVNTHTHELSSR